MSKLSFIIGQMKEFLVLSSEDFDAAADIDSVEFIDNQTELLRGRIYLARPNELKAMLESGIRVDKGTVVFTGESFSTGECAELMDMCIPRGINLCCSELPMYSLSNRINGIMNLYQKQAEQFLQIGTGHSSLQSTLMLTADITGCALFLLSPTYHIMNSAGKCRENKWLDELLNTNTLPQEAVEALFSCNADKLYTHYHNEKMGQHLHIYPIIYSDKPIAFLLLVDDAGKAIDFEYILKYASKNITDQIIRLKQEDYDPASDFAKFWDDMVKQKIRTAPEILERLGSLPYPPKLRRRVGVIIFEDSGGQLIPFDFILAQLREVFPEYNMAVYKGEIVILICEQERKFNVEIDEKRVNAILSPYNGFMCIGHSTSDLTKMRTQYLLSRHALIVAKKLRLQRDENTRVFLYERYTTYVLIDMFAHRFQEIHGNNDIIYLAHPAVVKITRYDREHNNNLRDVLYYYLINDRNLVRTAEAMHMHRNTVFYKINQIKELIGLDLEDGRLQQDLLLSCQILRYYEGYMGETVRM